MPIELGIWRIDERLERVEASALDKEDRLEDILHQDISIASPLYVCYCSSLSEPSDCPSLLSTLLQRFYPESISESNLSVDLPISPNIGKFTCRLTTSYFARPATVEKLAVVLHDLLV